MCGIAGYFGTQDIDPRRIEETLRLMGRRGPDHAGVKRWTNGKGRNAYLLHTRLKIIDLEERSNQPFSIDPLWIAFNGEIYNYLEVRADLARRGFEFRTQSDTEVLLRAIREGGWSALDRCEGMWAFAVYNEADGSLTLSRDRFGEKPLYVYEDASGVYFGSEIKFIVALLGRRLPVNRDHLYRYLVNGYKSLYKSGQTFFEGLQEVPSAAVLRFDADGSKTASRYWEARYAPDASLTYSDAVAGVRERLIRSVDLRLRADVPLAFCMSGGVDSNALISIAKNVFRYDVHGFTIVSTDSRYEEQAMIDHAVKEQKLKHTPIEVNTRDFLPRLRELVRYHDSPVATITYYAHWLLMESIAQHGYKISISGTAADELFTGYYDHHLAYLYEVRGDAALYEESERNWRKNVRPIVRNPFLGNPRLFIDDPQFRGHIYLNSDGFASCLKRDWSESFQETRFTDNLLRNRMMNEMFYEAVPVILHEDDLNAMYFSIENRSPFLDRNLFEFCYTIPSRLLIREGRAKSVLRDAMKGIVPQGILDNPRKVGFNVPIFSFLDVGDPKVRESLLDRSPIYDHIRRESIEALLPKGSLPNSESKFLFYFLTSKIFLEEFSS